MFRLSIIVPADGSQADLDNTLLTVLENRPAGCQVIVPHPKTYQDPYDLSDEVEFVCVPEASAEDLGRLLNAAIAAADSEIIHILLSGTLARDGWTDAPLRQFEDQPALSAIAPAIFHPHNTQRLTAAGIRYGRGGKKQLVAKGRRGLATGKKPVAVDGPLLQAAFIRREVLAQLGGLRDVFGAYHIDTDLAARLRAADMSCAHEPASQLSGFERRAPRGFRAARRAELLYWCHVHPLAQRGALTCHLLHSLGDVLWQIPRPSALTSLLGRACGLPQGLLKLGPQPVAPQPSTAQPVSIHIDSGRRRTRADAQVARSSRRLSRSA